MATPDEGQEFARLRRMMEKEKDVKKVIRDLLLQEAAAHSTAYLLAKNHERIIALFAEKGWRRACAGRPTEPGGRLSQYICTGMV